MRHIFLALLSVTLLSCGGGESSGSGTPGGPGGTPPAWSGNTLPAAVSTATVAGLADWAMGTLVLAGSIGADVLQETATAGSVDEAVPGPDGGTVQVEGSIENGRGELNFRYTNYRDGEAVLNGRERVEILAQQTVPSRTYNSQVRHSFDGFAVRDLTTGETFALEGSITTSQTPGTADALRLNATIGGDVIISLAGRRARINNLQLLRTYQDSPLVGEGFWQLSGRARVHESTAGYLDLEIESPMPIRDADPLTGPVFGGSALLTGAAGARFWISPLSRDYVALEIDDNADGTPDRSLSYRWDEGFVRPAYNHSGPVAITGPDVLLHGPSNPGPFHLDGRFSEHSGGNFLSQQWSLAFAPPGSTAAISAAQTARAMFQPDQNGTYLFQLRVSDGTSVSHDYLRVLATGFSGLEQSSNTGQLSDLRERRRARAVTEPDLVADPGSTVRVDGRRSFVPDGAPAQSRWGLLERSAAADTVLQQGQGDPFQFVSTGTRLMAGLGSIRANSADEASPGVVMVVPPSNRRMAPTVELPSLTGTGYDNSLVQGVADFNGDGVDDVLLMRPDHDNNVRLLRVLLGGASGALRSFGPELPIPGAFQPTTSPGVAIVELNADGRMDLVAVEPAGISYYLQTGDAEMPFGVRRAASSACGAPGYLHSADIDGDGDRDVVANSGCTTTEQVLFRNDNGTLAAASAIAVAGVATLDLNADGRADFIDVSPFGATSSWLGTASPGTYVPGPAVPAEFAAGANYPMPRRALLVADLDDDGRDDAVAGAAVVHILWQSLNGSLSLQTTGSPGGVSGGQEVVAIRDFDGDGLKDILGVAGWYKQTATRTFAAWQAYARGFAEQVADINGDGLPDLLYQSQVTLQSP